MSQTWVRLGAGLAAFVLIAVAGLGLLSGLAFDEALERFALVMVVALPAGLAAYALVEYAQTRRLDSITRQFDTRTIVLMPVAMALNIVLGTAVASALKVPIYLDSIGTVLVAALAGPLAGAATGFLSNVVWTYLAPPPFQSPYAAPFAVVAVGIGLLAGSFARWGWLRPRVGAPPRQLLVGGAVASGIIVILSALALSGWSAAGEEFQALPRNPDAALLILGWAAVLLVGLTIAGLVALLALRRDLTAAYLVVAGTITGVVAAFIAAPIASGIFGGVTGSGADFVIAALRAAGADLQQAVLGQSLLSDPVDKVITFFVAYLILGAMAVRTKARFPQGESLLPLEEAPDDVDPGR